ncbi:hypothetical protein RJ640_021243 [Escallonia rubra]|uniref:Pentatricopeptide repeat-containing protein n=1 Tax=Escallonia rubra TaxID=112253 RepID=A0AA88UGJ3_9ASTE|nr:hypothetical protein RJ640_021243 [Escallonia rubra]
MSKTLLSRIKPHQNPKPNPSPNFPFLISTKRVVKEVCEILRTHAQWEQTLETRLSEEEIVPSDIAHQVFDKIHDVELGLKFLDWVNRRPYGCSLDGFAYSSLLKLLAKSRVFSEVEMVLESMKCREQLPTRESLDVVIKAYSQSGFVDKALEMYHFAVGTYSLSPNVLACNSLLDALVKKDRNDIARQVYDEMVQRDDGSLDNYSTCIVLRGLCKEGKVEEGRKLIEDRWGEGCIPNVVFYNTLIHGYFKKGDVERARALFKELQLKGFLPTAETYGAMIDGFCKGGKFEWVDRLLEEMNLRGLTINVKVYNSIIDAQYRHGGTRIAVETIRKMIESGCEPDLVTYNILICGSCRNEKVQEAEELLEQATIRRLVPNKLSYTPIIHGYCRQGYLDKALNLLVKMMNSGHKPDLVTYGSLVHGLVVAGEVDAALTCRGKMMEKGVLLDARIYNVLMSGLCKRGRLPAAKQLLGDMLDQNVLPDTFVYATLVDGFIRNGDLDEAKRLFELAIERSMDPDVVLYNSMIKGYCKFGMMKDAVSCIKRMIRKRISPDKFTYSTIIDGCIKQHDLDGALRIFGHMVKQKCKPNVVTYTSLINGFCRKGDSSGGERLFSEMQSLGLTPNVVTYSILIGSFCKEGKVGKAASFFEQMLMSKCNPNDVTFHYLINGFSNHAPIAVSKKALESDEHNKSLFLDCYRRMSSDGWLPTTAAYNSILTCLCLFGMLKTALQLSEKMTRKGCLSDSVTFAALLHGVCLEGKSEEWKSIISFNLNETELYVAEKYSLVMDQYLPHGVTSKASPILRTLIRDYKPRNQDVIHGSTIKVKYGEVGAYQAKTSYGVIRKTPVVFDQSEGCSPIKVPSGSLCHSRGTSGQRKKRTQPCIGVNALWGAGKG